MKVSNVLFSSYTQMASLILASSPKHSSLYQQMLIVKREPGSVLGDGGVAMNMTGACAHEVREEGW